MNDYNLLESSVDLFKKLVHDYTEFKNHSGSRYKALGYKALDCALSGWHLLDWVFNTNEKSNYQSLYDLRQAFEKICPELSVLHDIITGGKHFTVSKGRSNMVRSYSSGYVQNGYVQDGYVATELIIEFDNNQSEPYLQIIDKVVDFWFAYFHEKGLA
ncbi:hypothetical protein SAMN06265337_2239 [Hymenobacter gelipurpurascens]|uniref:Uncharacterized protein n=1 Tax=Hymenobacter gelipurpurascens TaxID=89968 RepID=A0A212TQZ5_9BACT|nr:hypothetical protein [Hymenobacter gelipurpurascens]SNC68281.1 hypothetical protein SAMN06265337_2239 [Hymenobacter gelipurpurascens]